MRSSGLNRFLSFTGVACLLTASMGVEVFAQGRGKDGNGKGRGNQEAQQSRQDKRGGEREEQRERSQRPNREQGRIEQRSRQQEVRNGHGLNSKQQTRSDSESRRKQTMSDRNSRSQQARSDRESQRQQASSDRNSQRPQAPSDRESRSRQSRVSRERVQNTAVWSNYPQNRRRSERRNDSNDDRRYSRNDRDDDDRDDRQKNRSSSNKRARWNRANSGTPPWANRNYERPAYNRYIRDQRKAAKAYEKQQREYAKRSRERQRRYDRNWNWPVLIGVPVYQTSIYDSRIYQEDDRYYGNRRVYQQHPDYRQPTYGQIYYPQTRGSNGNNGYYENDGYYEDNGYHGDDGYYGDDGYNDDDYSYNQGGGWKDILLQTVLGVVFGGQMGGFDQGGFNQYGGEYQNASYLPYRQTGPEYYGQQPIYSTYVYGDPDAGYYQQDPYGYDQYGYDQNGSSNDLYSGIAPILMNIVGGDSSSFLTDLVSHTLASGYNQGAIDGQYAQQQGWGVGYYNDPYAYDSGVYNGSSVSLAERRQLLSQGYELGYRDAMNERNSGYHQEASQNFDLTTLLLDNVLRIGV